VNAHHAATTLCIAGAAGIFLIAIADRLRVPSIALLLVGGIVLGPEVLGLLHPESLGGGLETVVTLAVAIVLFEGGLTLDVAGFRREPNVIIRMLTIGVLVTWAGAALAVWGLFGTELELAIIAGSLVIVTGPTVVSPLLRRIGVRPRLHHVLYWEGVLVDAVGVFVAVLCFEWIASSDGGAGALGRFALRFVVGAGIGLASGLALGAVLRRRWIGHDHANIVALATALLALGLANMVLPEAGILAVIVAGLVVSLQSAPQLKELKRFKLELTEAGIGLLFVLLAARLDLSVFVQDGPTLVAFLAVIVFLVRPVNVILSTLGQGFSVREKAFLSWLAPRGIVAASMASLFSLRLANLGVANAALLETLTYAVIGTTVIAQGLSAPRIAGWLGLRRSSQAAWLLVGDPDLTVELHRQLRQAGARSLVLAAEPPAGDDSVETVLSDPLRPDSIRDPRIADIEAVLSLSTDPSVNDRVCEAWGRVVGPAACYRWDGHGVRGNRSHGRAVWSEMPKPAEVKAGLANSQLALEAVDVGPGGDLARFGDNLHALLAVDEGRVQVVESVPPETAGAAVALRARTPGLVGLVRDAVIVDRHDATFAHVVDALLARAALTNGGLKIDAHHQDILERERTMPTTVGHGVAIPHVYDESVDKSSCYVASVVGGLDMATPDEIPITLVFLVVSPSGQATEHLQSLGALANLASDSDLVRVLGRQRTRGRLLTLIRERE